MEDINCMDYRKLIRHCRETGDPFLTDREPFTRNKVEEQLDSFLQCDKEEIKALDNRTFLCIVGQEEKDNQGKQEENGTAIAAGAVAVNLFLERFEKAKELVEKGFTFRALEDIELYHLNREGMVQGEMRITPIELLCIYLKIPDEVYSYLWGKVSEEDVRGLPLKMTHNGVLHAYLKMELEENEQELMQCVYRVKERNEQAAGIFLQQIVKECLNKYGLKEEKIWNDVLAVLDNPEAKSAILEQVTCHWINGRNFRSLQKKNIWKPMECFLQYYKKYVTEAELEKQIIFLLYFGFYEEHCNDEDSNVLGAGLCREVEGFRLLDEEDETLNQKRTACADWILKNGKEELIRLALQKNLIHKTILDDCVAEAMEEQDSLRRAMVIPLLLQKKWKEEAESEIIL